MKKNIFYLIFLIFVFVQVVNTSKEKEVKVKTVEGGYKLSPFDQILEAAENSAMRLRWLLVTNKAFNIDSKDSFGNTPLIKAIKSNRFNAAQNLIQEGASIDAIDKTTGKNVKELAQEHGFGKIFGKSKEKLELEKSKEELLLQKIISLDELKKLISKNLDINKRYEKGRTLLIKAVMEENKKAVENLISEGANILLKDDSKRTALDYAKIRNNKHILDLFKNLKRDETESILQIAASGKELSGLNINARDIYGQTPLIRAVLEENTKAAKNLIQAKADLDVIDNMGNNALILAIMSDNEVIANMILKAGAKIDYVDKFDHDVLDLARDRNMTKLAKKIIKLDKNKTILERIDKNKQNHLLKAAIKLNVDIVEAILRARFNMTGDEVSLFLGVVQGPKYIEKLEKYDKETNDLVTKKILLIIKLLQEFSGTHKERCDQFDEAIVFQKDIDKAKYYIKEYGDECLKGFRGILLNDLDTEIIKILLDDYKLDPDYPMLHMDPKRYRDPAEERESSYIHNVLYRHIIEFKNPENVILFLSHGADICINPEWMKIIAFTKSLSEKVKDKNLRPKWEAIYEALISNLKNKCPEKLEEFKVKKSDKSLSDFLSTHTNFD